MITACLNAISEVTESETSGSQGHGHDGVAGEIVGEQRLSVITHSKISRGSDATATVFQSLTAGGDVTVTTAASGETLNPPTGNTIPLVAGKRTVVRIDWWPAAV